MATAAGVKAYLEKEKKKNVDDSDLAGGYGSVTKPKTSTTNTKSQALIDADRAAGNRTVIGTVSNAANKVKTTVANNALNNMANAATTGAKVTTTPAKKVTPTTTNAVLKALSDTALTGAKIATGNTVGSSIADMVTTGARIAAGGGAKPSGGGGNGSGSGNGGGSSNIGAMAGVGGGGVSQDYINQVIDSIRGNMTPQADIALSQQIQLSDPTLMDIKTLADMYGINYDADSIYNTLKQGVDAQAETLYGRQKQSEGLYYDNAHTAQNTLMDSLNQVQSQAVGSGVNKGMQAANLLSTALGVSGQFAQQATALSQERGNIANTIGEALANARAKSEQTAYDRENSLAELARQIYAADIQRYTADATLRGDIDTNNAARQQANLNADVAMNQALAEAIANASNAKLSSDTTLGATRMQADATRSAAQSSADAQLRAAEIAAAANRYAANQNYLGQKAYADAYGSAASKQAANTVDPSILAALQAGTIADRTGASQISSEEYFKKANEAVAKKQAEDKKKNEQTNNTKIKKDIKTVLETLY